MNDYDDIVRQIAGCTRCALSERRTRTVPGDGSPSADIMFIGEAPGYNEDQQGLPFVGAAGNVLTDLLAGIGLSRSDVYITNMVKCRPDNNRDPLAAELDACSAYLDAQIELIDPKVIVTLGRFSFGKFFPGRSISRERGKPRSWRGRMIYPMYHPAATLHNSRLRPALQNDFRNLLPLVEEVIAMPSDMQQDDAAPDESQTPAQQLSMF
ncbi:MAG: uracil-DNA glycosylase [Chloroflexi bacterium]|nr:uracil-DNA glycosylase [Chloroflexota bacterium]